MQVNVNATFMLTRRCYRYYWGSMPARWSLRHQALAVEGRAPTGDAYATSKFATEGMMRVLADEYQTFTLRVNCVARAVRAPVCAGALSNWKITGN